MRSRRGVCDILRYASIASAEDRFQPIVVRCPNKNIRKLKKEDVKFKRSLGIFGQIKSFAIHLSLYRGMGKLAKNLDSAFSSVY